MREGYDVAQICLNGHSINSSAESKPEFNQDYCDTCGEKTIMACPICNTPIRGQYYTPGRLHISPYFPPSYCYKCGKPFPWTQQKIQAAIELMVEEGNLNKEEQKQLKDSINEIVKDTPRTQLGATRFKRILLKTGQQSTSAVRDIIVDIISESAKKIIWPN